MAWTPLHLSGLSFTNTLAAGVSYSDSVFTGVAVADPSSYSTLFRMQLDDILGEFGVDGVGVRLTFSSYSGEANTRFQWVGDTGIEEGSQDNTGGGAAFAPNPLTLTVYPHDEGSGEGWLFFQPTINDMKPLDFGVLIEVDVEGGGEPPEGNCFWTDLVNVEQFCSDEPPPVEGGISYAGAAGNCGGNNGRLVLYSGGDEMSDALDTALTIATEVTITGVYQDDIAAGDFENAVGDEMPGYVVFMDVNYPMEISGFYGGWASSTIEDLEATLGAWYRVDVDGVIYYAASPLTTAC